MYRNRNGIGGYLSRFEGIEVDDAVERVQNLDAELALKVDKTTTINGKSLESNIILTPEDIGALPDTVKYGATLTWNNSENTLYLNDQDGNILNSQYIETQEAEWGRIHGDLTEQTDLKTALDSKQPMITPSFKISSDLVDDTNSVHKFATQEQLNQIATNKNNIATNAGGIATNAENISDINGKIPEQASPSNQLADKDFVNSSISTNTANFIGTFNSVEELEAYSGAVTNNDYAFVISTDSEGNTVYNRYKYNGTEWLFEYALNNSSFTANQWEAINSGATTDNIEQITTNKNNITSIQSTMANFGDIVTYNASDFATAAQGARADSALQSIDGAMVVDALGYTPYDSANPAHYISEVTGDMISVALGYTPQRELTAGENITITTVESNWSPAVQGVGPSPVSGDHWIGITYENDKFVALSDHGCISTSMDGTTWTQATEVSNLSGVRWNSITYGDSKFVALGWYGYVSTSTDEINWTPAVADDNLGYLGSNGYYHASTFDGTKFITLSSQGYVSTSTNGTDWTFPEWSENLGSNSWAAVALGNNKYVALGYYGYVSTSEDGINWTTSTQKLPSTSGRWEALIFNGSVFIALSETGYFSTSEDGIDWIEPIQDTNLGNNEWESLAYNGRYVTAMSSLGLVSRYSPASRTIISANPGIQEIIWGDITGNIADQEDLKEALDNKQDKLNPENAGEGIHIFDYYPDAIDTTDYHYVDGSRQYVAYSIEDRTAWESTRTQNPRGISLSKEIEDITSKPFEYVALVPYSAGAGIGLSLDLSNDVSLLRDSSGCFISSNAGQEPTSSQFVIDSGRYDVYMTVDITTEEYLEIQQQGGIWFKITSNGIGEYHAYYSINDRKDWTEVIYKNGKGFEPDSVVSPCIGCIGTYNPTVTFDLDQAFFQYTPARDPYMKIEVDTTVQRTSNLVTSISSTSTDTQYPSAKLLYDELQVKQNTLVSGSNIKTINNVSILGSGNIDTGASWGNITGNLTDQADLKAALDSKASVVIRDWS